MERRLTEEQVTKAIIEWLENNNWEIICFDFPQSGTGVSLHLNKELRTTKNKGAFIPDIVAIKNKIVIFFENKDRFVFDDFGKVAYLKNNEDYSDSIEKLLNSYEYSEIYYGIGLAYSDNAEKKTNENLGLIDFVVFCLRDRTIKLHYEYKKIFG